ncbi:Aspyridones efflux apdF [Hyphodiscus hymeniophilus]|uniref:Aspyridones efflux apdF n=1 Tax=Hyphodiscus hymeniophilus TaxID=353542 RepID=A0A9P6SKV1_9HELO|nr:Aspyridones efflux apdF [Hyphodiscus hymeniophilus]
MESKECQDPDRGLSDLEDGSNEKSAQAPLAEKESNQTEFTPRACLVLLGAFGAMFCSVGFVNAFGVFETFYQTDLLSSKSPSQISWLGSFNIFCMFGFTLLVGWLNDRHGPRVLLIVGSVIMLFALFMTSLCTEYWQLFLAQGFLFGLGLSFVVLPAFATVPHYFIKSRALALGITVSGSSLGGVIWPIALKNVLYKIGFGWGVRTAAFIMLPLLAAACLAIRLPARAPSSLKPKPDLSVVKNPILILLALGLFFIYLGLFSPFFYVTSWTISRGLDANMAFYMVSIINAASLFGRIIPGLLADRFGAYNMMILSALFSGLVCCCWTTATSMSGIVVLSLAYGFSSGAVIGLQGACSAQIVEPSQYGVTMGFVMAILSVAGLLGSPINGWILGQWGFTGLSLFSGLAMLVGMLVLMVARLKVNAKVLAKA